MPLRAARGRAVAGHRAQRATTHDPAHAGGASAPHFGVVHRPQPARRPPGREPERGRPPEAAQQQEGRTDGVRARERARRVRPRDRDGRDDERHAARRDVTHLRHEQRGPRLVAEAAPHPDIEPGHGDARHGKHQRHGRRRVKPVPPRAAAGRVHHHRPRAHDKVGEVLRARASRLPRARRAAAVPPTCTGCAPRGARRPRPTCAAGHRTAGRVRRCRRPPRRRRRRPCRPPAGRNPRAARPPPRATTSQDIT